MILVFRLKARIHSRENVTNFQHDPQEIVQKIEIWPCDKFDIYKLLGITHLSPHNELVHLPYIAVAANTRAD